MKRLLRSAAGGLLALAVFPSRALAWGNQGHEAVAHVAEHRLTPTARARVAELLRPNAQLASVANWADDIRTQRPETKRWHYIDIPTNKTTQRADIARYCEADDCVVAQIELAERQLHDPATPIMERRQALAFLTHFVADLHQPLHCSNDDDRGGNDKLMLVPGQADPVKLHWYWDDLLGQAKRETPIALAERLRQTFDATRAAEWERGTPWDWAWEGFQIARSAIYADFPHGKTKKQPKPLPARYASAGPRQLVDMQLARAGVRLALILNRALDAR
ncbi:MAG: S1/P1 nuclease [Polyangiaceae bacterium]